MTANFLSDGIAILLQGGGVAWWVWGGAIAILAALVFWLVFRARNHRSLDTLRTPDREPEKTGASIQAASLETETAAAVLPGSRVEAPAGGEEPFQPYAEAVEQVVEMEVPEAIFELVDGGDDLKRIHGITPGVVSVLNAAGIHTFAQLSAASPDQLEKILRSAGMRLTQVDRWPELARQAAAGE